MLIFFSLHFLKDLGGRRVISFQSRGEVGVNARICFLGRDCEREDFLFRQVPEFFGHGISYRDDPTMGILFLRHLTSWRRSGRLGDSSLRMTGRLDLALQALN